MMKLLDAAVTSFVLGWLFMLLAGVLHNEGFATPAVGYWPSVLVSFLALCIVILVGATMNSKDE